MPGAGVTMEAGHPCRRTRTVKITHLIPRPLRAVLRAAYGRARLWILQSWFRDYSQHGETIAVRRLASRFGDRTFVEIGANDGVIGSTTLGLLKDGWTGFLIEANPAVYEKLAANMRRFPKAKTFCCAISPTRGRVKLFLGKDDPGGFLGTLATEDSSWYRAHRSEDFVEVDGLPLSDFLRENAVPARFELLLVDTEGMDLEILRTLDTNAHRPHVLVTEDYGPKNEAKHALLRSFGYKFVRQVGCNTVWVDGSAAGAAV